MSLNYMVPVSKFKRYLPKDYVELVDYGPFGKEFSEVGTKNMGKYKELVEEHPMCSGCWMAYYIKIIFASLPNPEHTVTIGTAGCGRLAISQAAVPFIYGNYGDQNAMASGITRAFRLRFPDQQKDVITIAGDGGMMDIGFSMTMHAWFRGEKFTTIMLDNEVYGNTGGQESGMSIKGAVLKMSPKGKNFNKMPAMQLAITAGCVYVVKMSPTNINKAAKAIRRAIFAARELGPTFIHAYTSCNIEYSIPTPDVFKDAQEMAKGRFAFEEFMTDEAKDLFTVVEAKKKKEVS
ncbi:MAG: Pyruvate:ferredoxin oxidoreductase, beta subunit (EC [uncultured Sulfurovum sp.]|uniref:Pyruvate:ferredoxin oxidoreductase, beta subunit (EC) n=1 Tax=uncultured Sulfurovum sp. TaxID=269237 RepID=A0A6S6TD21_9BACT|nr:MAG: Pyruvate:ferredoxin oxidoreductase, beta subunit (EC [uncultured Sulfurovum sp.]